MKRYSWVFLCFVLLLSACIPIQPPSSHPQNNTASTQTDTYFSKYTEYSNKLHLAGQKFGELIKESNEVPSIEYHTSFIRDAIDVSNSWDEVYNDVSKLVPPKKYEGLHKFFFIYVSRHKSIGHAFLKYLDTHDTTYSNQVNLYLELLKTDRENIQEELDKLK